MDPITNIAQKEPSTPAKRRAMLLSVNQSLGVMVRCMIEDEWELVCVPDCTQARQSLADVAVCLIDSWVPGGLSLLDRARKESIQTPIIWLGNDDEFTARAVRHGGAVDCLSLDILDGPLLQRALAYAGEKAESKRLLCESRQQLQDFSLVTQHILADFRDAILVTDDSGRIIYANLASGRLFGLDPLRLVGNAYPEITPEDEGLYEVEAEVDGKPRTLEVQVTHMLWHGEPARLSAVRDVTQRRQMEARLRRTYRALDAAMNGIIIADAENPEWPLVYANPAYERLTGFRIDEVLGKPSRLIQQAGIDPVAAMKIRSAIANGKSCHVVVRSQRKDGTPFWGELNLGPVRNEADDLTNYVVVINDVTAQVEARERLEWLSLHHSLCGLLNQNGLHQYVSPRLEAARARGEILYAFWINVDEFHDINDRFGHAIGDRVIIESATRLRARLGDDALLARIGGGEFIAVMNGLADTGEALQLANDIRQIMARPFELDGLALRLTCCVGISSDHERSKDGIAFLGNADIAMHQAKKQSPNSVAWFSQAMADKMRDIANARTDIQRAMEVREFVVHYQPQVYTADGRLIGVEAQVCWQHPERGLLRADQFMPLAEATGQVDSIGALVLTSACRDGAVMRSSGMSSISIAVGISTQEFLAPNFVGHVQTALRQAELPPEFLEIELRDTALSVDTGQAVRNLDALRRVGVRITLDGFGRGVSDLHLLRCVPVNKVKIDRTFIRDVISDARAAAITRGIASMAQTLHMEVVADAVESESQRSFLRRLGIDAIQGNLIADAMPLDAFLAWCRQRPAQSSASPAGDGGPEVRSILLVDDEPNILRALTRVLRRDGYRIHLAGNAREAFDVLAQHDVQVIISDQRMPEVCGTEFFAQVKDLYPDTVRMVLSGYTDLKSVTDAINEGAIYRFLTKPWRDDVLREDVRKAFAFRPRHVEDPTAAI